MPGKTLDERYYAINENINKFLKAHYVDCPLIKYGVDVATLKNEAKKAEVIYPYAKTSVNNIWTNPWTTEESGIFTKFDYQVNFFTSPITEFTNDSELFKAFEFIKLALTDINKTVLQVIDQETLESTMLADILSLSVIPGFGVISGAVLPSRILIAKMAAVCGYPQSLGDNGKSVLPEGMKDVLVFDFDI